MTQLHIMNIIISLSCNSYCVPSC